MPSGNTLKGRSFTITGAGSGIGRAIALACAREGANLCLAGRTLAKVQETVALIAKDGCEGVAIAVAADITSADAVRKMYEQAVATFGVIDGIVANAGVMAPSPPVHEIPEASWRSAIDTNLMGTVLTVSLGAKVLVQQGRGGSILATGSSVAIRPSPGMATYSTSKAAMHAYMKVAALDLAPHRIRVNTLVPGTSATPPLQKIEGFLARAATALPLGEVVSPEELGKYAAFVLSDALPHMTGATLVVDSGRTIA
jgi:NAD(P)-dependent dehydrogenase (short-subunit alcohol dehydrogenase family)